MHPAGITGQFLDAQSRMHHHHKENAQTSCLIHPLNARGRCCGGLFLQIFYKIGHAPGLVANEHHFLNQHSQFSDNVGHDPHWLIDSFTAA